MPRSTSRSRNSAADNGREPTEDEMQKIRVWVLANVRGTVQADILKEDQGQNTCIFSTEFALKMMGDIQEFFVHNQIGNFYSVSISGYHIAEAGANPISQLAFTLANGFTYVETYLARGMHIDDFAPNLSFFFSNGMDPEYSVIGRVARRIWAVAMKNKYGGNERSQKLKYHIQTSGRSLHAQEMAFNDIRTTLQALIAIYDNCNSLHTNAYDEAITTPTEESVRRAMAIQLIINREWGLAMNENPNQGSFIIDELTDLVEEAVLKEFEAIAARGGVLGAMETGYQRGKIQEESLYYEHKKHDGSFPIVGVNTFRNPQGDAPIEIELARSTEEEKQSQLTRLRDFQKRNAAASGAMIERSEAGGDRQRQRLCGPHGRRSGVLARADHRRAVRGRWAVPSQHVGVRAGAGGGSLTAAGKTPGGEPGASLPARWRLPGGLMDPEHPLGGWNTGDGHDCSTASTQSDDTTFIDRGPGLAGHAAARLGEPRIAAWPALQRSPGKDTAPGRDRRRRP
jgi:methylmalonyl-CoA mutase N-terminal domain/subunit